jgi:hypothetical protein
MSEPTDSQVLEAMRQYGGSFVQGLAALYLRADPENQAKLRAAFADEWAHYGKLATMAPRPRLRIEEPNGT